MAKLPIAAFILLMPLLFPHAATAAKFELEDLTGKQWCFGSAASWPTGMTMPRCSDYLPGTVGILVTPAPGELPIKCDDHYGFCMYAADVYVVARYHGQWLVRDSYAWRAVDFAELAPTTRWPPWSSTVTMAYHIEVATIDLNTSRAAPVPDGFEVWMALTPVGGKIFAPELVQKIYPLPPR